MQIITRPVAYQTDPDALVIVSWRVSTDYIVASSMVNAPIAANCEAVSDVIPFVYKLMHILHLSHRRFTSFRGETSLRYV